MVGSKTVEEISSDLRVWYVRLSGYLGKVCEKLIPTDDFVNPWIRSWKIRIVCSFDLEHFLKGGSFLEFWIRVDKFLSFSLPDSIRYHFWIPLKFIFLFISENFQDWCLILRANNLYIYEEGYFYGFDYQKMRKQCSRGHRLQFEIPK